MHAPGGNKVKIWQNLQVLHFYPHPFQGHAMSVKYEQPLDELTVQVLILYDHPNIALCKWGGIGQMDGQTIRFLDAHSGPFRPGASKFAFHT